MTGGSSSVMRKAPRRMPAPPRSRGSSSRSRRPPPVRRGSTLDPAPPAGRPAIDPDLHGALAALVGVWEGAGEGHYPTIDDFGYTEVIEVRPVPRKPICTYSSTTRAADDGRGLHVETGYLRIIGPDRIELVVAAAPGIVETCAGPIRDEGTGTELTLRSTGVHGTPTAKEVTATERAYRVTGDTLAYDLSMAAVGQPMTHHLRATLTRR